tara:strand:+ start:625 stop:1587 length:963 start_codon:yes stop_codon:yes gene_type:complete
MKKIDYIKIAKKSASVQIRELKKINSVFNKNFVKAADLISNCKGKLITAGIGKSGIIAKKISSTLSSVGVPSFFLSPDYNHGDLGQIEKKDVLLVFSYSGNTAELNNLLKYANRFNIKVIGVSSKKDSILLKASDLKILIPQVSEADPTKMVPTTSTSITLLFGDCLAIALMHKKKFSKERFKVFHPGGNIGRSLMSVKDIMITGKKLPTVNFKRKISEAIKIINKKNLGLVVITKNNFIKGILTDGDARRSMKYYSSNEKVEKFMSKNPIVVNEDTLASKALSIMNGKKITSLLVYSKKNKKKLKGIVHIHSLLQHGLK